MTATTTRSGEEVDAMGAARAMSSAVALMSRAVGRSLSRWNMTWPQAMSLLMLRAAEEPTNATRLVEQLGLGRTAMTAVVDRLERRGWVERKPHPRDRRVALLELTAAGRQVADEAAGVGRETLEAMLGKARLPARFDSVSTRLITKLRAGVPASA